MPDPTERIDRILPWGGQDFAGRAVACSPIFSRLPLDAEQYRTGDTIEECSQDVAQWFTAPFDELLCNARLEAEFFYENHLDPATARSTSLDWLAQLLGFFGEFWDPTWDEDFKRWLLASSYTEIWPRRGRLDLLNDLLNRYGFITGPDETNGNAWQVADFELSATVPATVNGNPEIFFIRLCIDRYTRGDLHWNQAAAWIRQYAPAWTRGIVQHCYFHAALSAAGEAVFDWVWEKSRAIAAANPGLSMADLLPLLYPTVGLAGEVRQTFGLKAGITPIAYPTGGLVSAFTDGMDAAQIATVRRLLTLYQPTDATYVGPSEFWAGQGAAGDRLGRDRVWEAIWPRFRPYYESHLEQYADPRAYWWGHLPECFDALGSPATIHPEYSPTAPFQAGDRVYGDIGWIQPNSEWKDANWSDCDRVHAVTRPFYDYLERYPVAQAPITAGLSVADGAIIGEPSDTLTYSSARAIADAHWDEPAFLASPLAFHASLLNALLVAFAIAGIATADPGAVPGPTLAVPFTLTTDRPVIHLDLEPTADRALATQLDQWFRPFPFTQIGFEPFTSGLSLAGDPLLPRATPITTAPDGRYAAIAAHPPDGPALDVLAARLTAMGYGDITLTDTALRTGTVAVPAPTYGNPPVYALVPTTYALDDLVWWWIAQASADLTAPVIATRAALTVAELVAGESRLPPTPLTAIGPDDVWLTAAIAANPAPETLYQDWLDYLDIPGAVFDLGPDIALPVAVPFTFPNRPRYQIVIHPALDGPATRSRIHRAAYRTTGPTTLGYGRIFLADDFPAGDGLPFGPLPDWEPLPTTAIDGSPLTTESGNPLTTQ